MDRPDAAALLAHRDFVAAIARRLLRDDFSVEDAVQETYLAALENPPPERVKLRAWLAGIARNVSNQLLRQRRRRREREKSAARRDAAPSTAELAERLVWQQRVVEGVLALDEPYRSAVLLRYYEDLPPREVARRLAVPVNTVRTRLRRALALLRGRLDSAEGGRAAGSLALLPLLRRPASAAAMKVTAGLLAILAVGVVLLVRALDPGTEGAGVAPAAGRRAQVAPPAEAVKRGDAFVSGMLVGSAAEAFLLGPGGVLHRDRVEPGPFRLHYDRAGGDGAGDGAGGAGGSFRLELRGLHLCTATFPLPGPETDVGEVRMRRAVSFGGRVLNLAGEPLAGVTVYYASCAGTGARCPSRASPPCRPSGTRSSLR